MPKRIHNYLDDPKPPRPYDEDEGNDYRTSPEALKILTRIENIVVKKKKVRTRYLNERVKIPREWNLFDLISVSKQIEVSDSARPLVVAKKFVTGIPDADEFRPGKPSDRSYATGLEVL